jgi:glycosyltransferase involved in cell wall biosynthesis
MTGVVLCANNIDEMGGAQRVVHVIAGGLHRRGHDVQVVGMTPFQPAMDFGGPYGRRVLMSQMWPRKTTQTERLRAELRSEAVAGWVDILKSEASESGIIIAAQVWSMELLADALAIVDPDTRARWSIIGQYHGSFAAAASGRDLGRILRSFSPVATFTALTPEDAESFTGAGMNNVRSMANPLAFWPDVTSDLTLRQHRTLLYMGRLSREKGVDLLLDAWSLIADDHPDWQLSIVGEGPESEALRTQAGSLAGIERVEWREATADPLSTFLEADLLVLPSRTEGLPLVVAEAQACGVPVVASDCSSGVRQLVGDWGALFAREDSRALAEALDRAMANDRWRIDSGARARAAMQAYRLDAILDDWEELFGRVLR